MSLSLSRFVLTNAALNTRQSHLQGPSSGTINQNPRLSLEINSSLPFVILGRLYKDDRWIRGACWYSVLCPTLVLRVPI